MRLWKVSLLLMVIALAGACLGGDIYVAKTGLDTNPGTAASPYLTVSKAATVAVAGDVVYIGQGVYEETLTPANSGTSGNPIIFQSEPGDEVQMIADSMDPFFYAKVVRRGEHVIGGHIADREGCGCVGCSRGDIHTDDEGRYLLGLTRRERQADGLDDHHGLGVSIRGGEDQTAGDVDSDLFVGGVGERHGDDRAGGLAIGIPLNAGQLDVADAKQVFEISSGHGRQAVREIGAGVGGFGFWHLTRRGVDRAGDRWLPALFCGAFPAEGAAGKHR